MEAKISSPQRACERQAPAALPGLHDHGMALGRARHRERTARFEPFADVVERADLGRVGEEAGGLVGDDGVVGPGGPMAHHDLDELVGAVVAQVVLEMLVLAEVGGLGIVQAT